MFADPRQFTGRMDRSDLRLRRGVCPREPVIAGAKVSRDSPKATATRVTEWVGRTAFAVGSQPGRPKVVGRL